MTNITADSALGEVMAELKAIREDIRKLDRKVDDFRSKYDHHSAQESRVHREIHEDIRSMSGEVARFNGGINSLSRDLGRVDERVGLLESAI